MKNQIGAKKYLAIMVLIKKGHKRRVKEFLENMAIYTPNLLKEKLHINSLEENKWQFSSNMLKKDITLIDNYSQQYGLTLEDKPEDVQIIIKTLHSLVNNENSKNKRFASRILGRYGNS